MVLEQAPSCCVHSTGMLLLQLTRNHDAVLMLVQSEGLDARYSPRGFGLLRLHYRW